MIYLVIGPSCSGKTQFVSNSFLDNSDLISYKDILKLTKSKNNILIGDYTKSDKVRGTDRISRSQLKLIAPQIIKLHNNQDDLNIVAEGINVCYPFVMDALLPYKENVKLVYIYCTKAISLDRNIAINKNANLTWFKSVWTKSHNTFLSYCDKYDSYILNTNYGIDFNTISLSNSNLIKGNPNEFGILF